MANRSDDANGYEAEIRRNYAMVCRCEWEDQGYDEVIVATSRDCVIHGDVDDPLLTLMGDWNKLRDVLAEIKALASDPWASEVVALRACLLAAFDGLGLPAPEDSPEREIARAIIKEVQSDG